MSTVLCPLAEAAPLPTRAIAAVISPQDKDLGDFSVRRSLPSRTLKRVGPCIFFDHFGPARLNPGQALDVHPHPHIGLSTLTYLFDGEIRHKDSLGTDLGIRPGAVNWMTAGRGITHSERTPTDLRRVSHTLHGLQLWIALPDGEEECAPSFTHIAAADLPIVEHSRGHYTLIAGTAFARQSPVPAAPDLLLVEVRVDAGDALWVPARTPERALYVVDGAIEVDGQTFGPKHLVIVQPGQQPRITVRKCLHAVWIGGAPLASDRIVWWNFCARSKARMERAKADWRAGRFPVVPGERERIPLP